MSALLELQRSMREHLWGAAAPSGDEIFDGVPAERIAIYRNTCISALVNVLRLSFPAVQRLVGTDFFEGAAREFIRDHAPLGAYLNDYGAEFPQFLLRLPAAAALPYLGEVAQLEWAINRALHAADVPVLDIATLAALEEVTLPTVGFTAHPSLSLLRLQSPADAIWRAVLDQDEAGMAAVNLNGGPVHLLIERTGVTTGSGVQVRRLSAPAWQFTAGLCSGKPLFAALEATSGLQDGEINALLADHLASGRFIDFRRTGETVS